VIWFFIIFRGNYDFCIPTNADFEQKQRLLTAAIIAGLLWTTACSPSRCNFPRGRNCNSFFIWVWILCGNKLRLSWSLVVLSVLKPACTFCPGYLNLFFCQNKLIAPNHFFAIIHFNDYHRIWALIGNVFAEPGYCPITIFFRSCRNRNRVFCRLPKFYRVTFSYRASFQKCGSLQQLPIRRRLCCYPIFSAFNLSAACSSRNCSVIILSVLCPVAANGMPASLKTTWRITNNFALKQCRFTVRQYSLAPSPFFGKS